MRINYLFSDISKEQGFNEIQREYLKKDIKNNDTIVFIATTFDDYEKNDLYYNNLIKHFKNIDITFNKAYLIDNRVAKDLAKDYILKSNIIFLIIFITPCIYFLFNFSVIIMNIYFHLSDILVYHLTD